MTLKWLLHVLITQLSLNPSPPSICHPLVNLCSNLSYSLSWDIPLYSEAPYWQLLFLHTCSIAHPLQLSHRNFSETVTHSYYSRFTTLEELCFTARDGGLGSSVTLSNSPASPPLTRLYPSHLFSAFKHSTFLPLPVLSYSYQSSWWDEFIATLSMQTQCLLLEEAFLNHVPITHCAVDDAPLCSVTSWCLSPYNTSPFH